MSRPFARRHAVIAVGQGEGGRLAHRAHRPLRQRRCASRSRRWCSARSSTSSRRSATSSRSSTASTASAPACAAPTEHLGDGKRGPGARAARAAPLGRGARHRHGQRRARDRGGRLPAELRLRAARLGHPPRAARQRRARALPHRRHPARHREGPAQRCTAPITSRVKVLARMDIAERRRPQDGRIKTMRGDREVELRVSSLATAFGEKIVVRVFDPTVLMTDLAAARLRRRATARSSSAGSPRRSG